MNGPSENRPDDTPVPRLPRGRGFGLPRGTLFRIAMFGTLLVGVLLLREPCSQSVGSFIGSFDDPDAGPTAPRVDAAAPAGREYIRITGDMSDEEIQRRLSQAGVLDVPDGGADGKVGDAGPIQKDGLEE